MRSAFSTLLVFILTNYCLAQETIKPSGNYFFTKNRFESLSQQRALADTTSAPVDIYRTHKIRVEKVDSQNVYYTYWKFDKPEDSAIYNDKVFVLPLEEFNDITAIRYNRRKGWRVGVYTVPFRLRGIGEDFDFESSLSLLANLVWGYGNEYEPVSKWDFSVGIGLTGAKLTSKNSNVLADRTANAFTTSAGAVYKFNDYANIGAFVGFDFLGSSDKEVAWKYNKKPWLGVGINIAFAPSGDAKNDTFIENQ
jgi:hypothetical protein